MDSKQIGEGSWTEAFHQYRDEVMEKIRTGRTEDAIFTGASAYTQTEWKKVLASVDKQIDDIREEQDERLEKLDEKEKKEELTEDKSEAARLYEAAASMKGSLAEMM